MSRKKVGFRPFFLLLVRAEELFPAFRAGSGDDELAPVSVQTEVCDVVGLTKTEQVRACDGDRVVTTRHAARPREGVGVGGRVALLDAHTR